MKPLPPTYVALAVVLTLVAHFVLPRPRVAPFPWNLLGLVPLGLGAVLNLAADRQLKVARTTVKPFETPTTLVTAGVFALSRNPIYLGMVLLVAGIALLEGSAAPWIFVAALAILLDRVFIVAEERSLAAGFGVAFDEYRRRVRRWI